jgi:hypothetical protein
VKLERKDGLLVLTLANPDGNRIGLGVLTGLEIAEIGAFGRKPGYRRFASLPPTHVSSTRVNARGFRSGA